MKFNQNSDETLFTDEFKIPKGTSENTRVGVYIYNSMENYSNQNGGANWHYKRPYVIGTSASYRTSGIIYPPNFRSDAWEETQNSIFLEMMPIISFQRFSYQGMLQAYMVITI